MMRLKQWRNDPLVRAIGLLHVRPSRVVLAILAGVGAIGSAIALAAVSAWLIARASQMPPVLHLTVAVVAVRTFGITRGVLRYSERLASHDVALRGMAHLREQLYLRLAQSRSDRVVQLRRGDVLQRVGADVDAVGDVVVRAIIPVGVATVLGLGSAGLMFYFLPAAGLSLLACLILAAVLGPVLTLRAVRRAEIGGAQARGDIAAHTLTSLQAAAELRVTGGEQQLRDALAREEAALTSAQDAAARPAGWSEFVLQAAMGLAVMCAVVFGGIALAAGNLEPVELAVIALTPLAAFEPIQALPEAAQQWYRSRSAAQRIMTLISDEEVAPAIPTLPDDSDGAQSDTAPAAAPDQAAAPAAPEPGGAVQPGARRRSQSPLIAVRNLTIGWDPAHPATENLSFEVTAGQAVAVVGPSGAGKTALLLTLSGMLPPLAGAVRVAGTDPLTWTDGAQRQEMIALNLEDAHIFHTTVLENLRVARGDTTAAEARAALENVGLGPWLESLPAGVDTMLGPDATDVSGGERRRLLIARALLSRARVLLIDEPAEHLDSDTADDLVRDLLALAHRAEGERPGRAVILVTHRHAPLDAADRVIEIRAAQPVAAS